MQNEDEQELINALLTRVQKPNDWKNTAFKIKFPDFLQGAMDEIDCLWRE